MTNFTNPRLAKKTMALSAFLLAVGLSSASLAHPADSPEAGKSHEGTKKRGKKRGCDKKRRHQRAPKKMMERFDKNGNGVLEFSEIPKKRLERFRAADLDKNKSLTVEELKAYRLVKRTEKLTRAFAKRDANHDGYLTEDEVGKRWRRVVKADNNGDARVSFGEFKSVKLSRKQSRR